MRLTRLFEALDDKDQFMPDRCDYCENVLHYDPSNIGDDFHVAHTQAEGLATDKTGWFDDDIFIDEMRKRGYVKQYHLQQYLWTKTTPLKEDLDDKDEFHAPNVHHHQAWDSTEDEQHWTITMHNHWGGDQRIEGEYWVIGGMGKGMYLTTNFSDVNDPTAKRMLEDASSHNIGDFYVDWEQSARTHYATR